MSTESYNEKFADAIMTVCAMITGRWPYGVEETELDELNQQGISMLAFAKFLSTHELEYFEEISNLDQLPDERMLQMLEVFRFGIRCWEASKKLHGQLGQNLDQQDYKIHIPDEFVNDVADIGQDFEQAVKIITKDKTTSYEEKKAALDDFSRKYFDELKKQKAQTVDNNSDCELN